MATKPTNNFYSKMAPVLLLAVVGLSFAVGVLWQKVNDLSKGGTKVPTNVDTQVAPPAAPITGKLTQEQADKLPKIGANDHIRGNADAEVYLIEYSDFECPFCASFHPTAKQALSEYGDKFAWVYRHFPLDSIHPKARPAANASECVTEIAGKDAFWRFADEVFTTPASLADLSATAVKLGVNKGSFDNCLTASTHEAVVDADYNEGMNAGVTGTPGNFIVNSKGEVWLLPGAVPYSSLKEAIDEALTS